MKSPDDAVDDLVDWDADDPMYPLLDEGVPALARRTNGVWEGELRP